MIPVREFEEGKYLLMATRKGMIKKTALSAYANVRKTGLAAMTLREDDEMIEVKIVDDQSEAVLVSKFGQIIRFKETDVRPTGRTSMGVRGMTLAEGDEIVGMQLLTQGSHLLFVSEKGLGKLTKFPDFRTQYRGGKGIRCYKITEKTGNLVGAKAVNEEDEVLLITTEGVMIRTTCSSISILGRDASGVKVMNLADGVSVAIFTKVKDRPPIAEEEEAQESPEDLQEDETDEIG